MKHLRSYTKILENLAQAKAIIRKKGVDQSDPIYQQILTATNRDGYTGLIVRFVFKDGVDIQEALDLYGTFKQENIDAGKLSKMSYDDILDLVFSDVSDDKGIKYVFDIDNYRCYLVTKYEDGLDINSPAWCLKTKSHWDRYTEVNGGVNFTLIDKNYVDRNNIKLPVPNTFFGDVYTNIQKPTIRLGFTIYRTGSYEAFNDNNTHIRDEKISEKLYSYLKDNGLLVRADVNIEDYIDGIIEYIEDYFGENDIPTNSFRGGIITQFDTGEDDGGITAERLVEDMLNVELDGINLKQFFLENKGEIMKSTLSTWNGVMDIVLYTLYGKDVQELAGFLLRESIVGDLYIRYTYGDYKYKWGKRYITQSYSITEYGKILAEKSFVLYTCDEDSIYGEINSVSQSETNFDIITKYIEVNKISNGYLSAFRVIDYINDYPGDLYKLEFDQGKYIRVPFGVGDIEDIVGVISEYGFDVEFDDEVITIEFGFDEIYEGE